MTSWAEGRTYSALERDDERLRAERVDCDEPGCGATVGVTCRDVHNGEPLGKLPAHHRRMKRATETPAVSLRVWDAKWQHWYDLARRRGKSPNAAIPIAYRLTEDQYGQRPTSNQDQE